MTAAALHVPFMGWGVCMEAVHQIDMMWRSEQIPVEMHPVLGSSIGSRGFFDNSSPRTEFVSPTMQAVQSPLP